MIYFTSDTHFCHENILKYCQRPFKNIEAMNEALIQNWNKTVQFDEDEVYHLGDFALGNNPDQVCDILERLRGRKFLIIGNHDKVMFKHSGKHGKKPADFFEWTKDYHKIKIRDEEMDLRQRIVLSHYPMEVWHNNHHGAWHLHGHCHGTLKSRDSQARLDVGVDPRGMRPISYEEVKMIMTRKVFKPLDHHGDEGRTAP